MAGKFRGSVGKLSKTKQSKSTRKAKGKKISALVKRSPKLSTDLLQARIAELTSSTLEANVTKLDTEHANVKAEHKFSKESHQKEELTNNTMELIEANLSKHKNVTKKLRSRHNESINNLQTKAATEKWNTRKTRRDSFTTEPNSAKAAGLTMLRTAVKNQSHNKLLPHQNRHDYEYRLRNIATLGVVKLFNSLATAHKAGQAVLSDNSANHLTQQKALEKKQVLSRDAFLAALRRPESFNGNDNIN